MLLQNSVPRSAALRGCTRMHGHQATAQRGSNGPDVVRTCVSGIETPPNQEQGAYKRDHHGMTNHIRVVLSRSLDCNLEYNVGRFTWAPSFTKSYNHNYQQEATSSSTNADIKSQDISHMFNIVLCVYRYDLDHTSIA